MIRILDNCRANGLPLKAGAKISLAARDERDLILAGRAVEIASCITRDMDAVADVVEPPKPKRGRRAKC